jgi:hypothetical protein
MDNLEKYKRYLEKKETDAFGEPFWLPLDINFDAPADINTRRQFYTKTHSHDLLVVGCVSMLVDPFATDSPTRLVPKLEVEFKDASGNLFIRDKAPLEAVVSHIFNPELWHESFVIPKNTSLEVDLTVVRSPTIPVSVNPEAIPQGVSGTLTFKCVRFNRKL